MQGPKHSTQGYTHITAYAFSIPVSDASQIHPVHTPFSSNQPILSKAMHTCVQVYFTHTHTHTHSTSQCTSPQHSMHLWHLKFLSTTKQICAQFFFLWQFNPNTQLSNTVYAMPLIADFFQKACVRGIGPNFP